MKKKIIILIGIPLLLASLFMWLNGFRFTEKSAITFVDYWSGKINIVSSVPTVFGKAVTYESVGNKNFGVVHLNRYFGFLWKSGGVSGAVLEPGIPFKVCGRFDRNDMDRDQFVVGVKVSDQIIRYIVLGNDFERNPSDPYSLTLEDVKRKPNIYQVKKVSNGYVIFICNDYNENNYTFSAFDQDGRLIADQIFGADPRYLR